MPATSDSTLTYAPKSGIVRTLETATQQDYAAAAHSHMLPPWAKQEIAAARDGQPFDVWIFQQALMQAMSAATTRDGASTARRSRARKIRHLFYWSSAILEKTLANMEPVDGPTSPALTAARDQLEAANERITALIREKTEAEAALVQAEEVIDRANRLLGRAERALTYAFRIMNPSMICRVRGYQDALDDEA